MSIVSSNSVCFVVPADCNALAGSDNCLLKQLVETCGYQTTCVEGVANLPVSADAAQLIFVDIKLTSNLCELLSCCTRSGRWVFFNVTPGAVDELTLLMAGAEGVFYTSDKPELLLKGIHRLNKFDVWFKRDTVNRAFRQLREKSDPAMAIQNMETQQMVKQAGLTKREKNILLLVSKGAQNQEIADALHISVNTVKTHIYSIFRKTNSRNRVELVAWSSSVFG